MQFMGWDGNTFTVNQGTYRSELLVSGTLTTALYFGEIRTGTNTGQAGGWTDGQLGKWERVARDGSKEGITRKKRQQLSRDKLLFQEHLTTTRFHSKQLKLQGKGSS